MKKLMCLCVVAVMSFIFMTDAAAQGNGRCARPSRSINARQDRQRERIRQGVRSDELTRRETARLAREQRELREQQREARADGNYTRLERAELQQEYNQASRHIYRAKHNRRDRN